MSVKCMLLKTPLLYRKTGGFLIFVPRHRLWVLVRTGKAVLTFTHNLKIQNFPSIFNGEKILCTLHRQVLGKFSAGKFS